ncbi:predicted protein [Sclerotinia sclerotiorum 1980 UF-70]|uniref:Uncharacterized protein n=1 Tax=Sclerotinia sclerotiorum (strain ATCC 18683 / 1980 / Ss-1) TaxID=665079 RepID=A7EYS3_SCLS1|nr:predicted protein [Sclerotinia sclerotiorum 1980 UF-70]EDN94615.1 predicted protein [Sclerotinia sclerotiorum 1980 UF-70]
MFQPTKKMWSPVPLTLSRNDCANGRRFLPSWFLWVGFASPLDITRTYTDINEGLVVGVAVGFAFYSLGRKLVVDKQMRLSRQNRKD